MCINLLFLRLRNAVLDCNLLVRKKSKTDLNADWFNPFSRLKSSKILAVIGVPLEH